MTPSIDPDRLSEIAGRFVAEGATPEEADRMARAVIRADEIAAAYPVVSIESVRVADIPPRQWSIDGIVPRGELTIVGARKGLGKSWLLLQAGKAIAEGARFLGVATTFCSRVLYWPSEMDEIAVHERAIRLGPLPDGLDVCYAPMPRGEDLLDVLPVIIERGGYGVVILDMLQAAMPVEQESNAYEIGHFLLALRRVAMASGAAIVGSWHNGKADRDDPVLSLIGSTGIGAQAGSIITIDRKRRADRGKIYISGNHARESVIAVAFDNGLFMATDDAPDAPHLAPADRDILSVIEGNHDGVTAPVLATMTGKSPAAVRAALSRLRTASAVDRLESGAWIVPGLAPSLTAHEPNRSAQTNAGTPV